MTWANPLDLKYLLVNTLSGSWEIFTGIMILFIVGLAAYFRMPYEIAGVMLGLFFIIMSPFIAGSEGIMFLIIIIASLIAGISLVRIITK